MKMKTFFASTMQDALKQVRESLGAEAVIMSSKKTGEGVELVAALNYNEEALANQYNEGGGLQRSSAEIARMEADKLLTLEHEKARTRSRIESKKQKGVMTGQGGESSKQAIINELETQFVARNPENGGRRSTAKRPTEVTSAKHSGQRKPWPTRKTDMLEPSQAPHADSEAIRQMQSQISQLQELLTLQIAQTEKKNSVVYQELEQRLVSMGLEVKQVSWLLEGKEKERDVTQCWRQIVRQMSDRISIGDGELIDQPGCVAFLGATGAGKTTTIGKLAARFVLKYGAENIALVTTDRYRIAAHEQLRVFGRILNISVSVVDEDHSLNDVLDGLQGKQLVLIDTAGLNLNSEEWRSQMTEFEHCQYEIKHCLVVPSTTQRHILKSTYHAHRKVGVCGCVVTKLDEAISLGEILGFLWQVDFPVNYLTDGQRIPDDIHPARAEMLIGKSLELMNSKMYAGSVQTEQFEAS